MLSTSLNGLLVANQAHRLYREWIDLQLPVGDS